MQRLNVVLDGLEGPPSALRRSAEELTSALIAQAPDGCEVAAFVASSPEPVYAHIADRLPGLASLEKSALARRELAASWRRGLARVHGMTHAVGLLAPLAAHDRLNGSAQLTATVHDAIAWTHPELLDSGRAGWTRAMGRRAERYADAVVVPSHAVAEALGEVLDLGDRIRIVPGAPSASLLPTGDPHRRARELELPERYLLTVAGPEPHKDLATTLAAVTRTSSALPLVVATSDPEGVRALAAEAGTASELLHVVDSPSDADLGVLYHGAHAYLQSSVAEGFGLAVLEALAFGLPVVHTAVPALDELTAGAAISVARDDPETLPARLAEAIDAIDGELADRLSTAAGDRSRAFSWRDSADKIWQLHADL